MKEEGQTTLKDLHLVHECDYTSSFPQFLMSVHVETLQNIIDSFFIPEGNLYQNRARPGFEPGTSRTQSENHTPRPTSHMNALSLNSSQVTLTHTGNFQQNHFVCS